MKVLIVDNYDSFTYNLYQAVGELLDEKGKSHSVVVQRNDSIDLHEALSFDRIILSPGPGNPKDKKYFGVCIDILQNITTIPILGVCLGMQGMAYYFGGSIIPAKQMMHGKTSRISHDGKGIFSGITQGVSVMRYHSLVADPKSVPECLEISAIVQDSSSSDCLRGPAARHPRSTASQVAGAHRGTPTRVTPMGKIIEIMGLRHKKFPIEGVQFHPESFATEEGKHMLGNFLFGGSV